MTPEQEKMALDRLAGELATLKIMLRQLRAEGRIFLVCPMSQSTHGKGPLRYAVPCVSGDHINWASCSGDVLPPSPPAEQATYLDFIRSRHTLQNALALSSYGPTSNAQHDQRYNPMPTNSTTSATESYSSQCQLPESMTFHPWMVMAQKRRCDLRVNEDTAWVCGSADGPRLPQGRHSVVRSLSEPQAIFCRR